MHLSIESLDLVLNVGVVTAFLWLAFTERRSIDRLEKLVKDQKEKTE